MDPCFMKTRGRKKIPEFYVEVYGVRSSGGVLGTIQLQNKIK